jgi:hypothetical protein
MAGVHDPAVFDLDERAQLVRLAKAVARAQRLEVVQVVRWRLVVVRDAQFERDLGRAGDGLGRDPRHRDDGRLEALAGHADRYLSGQVRARRRHRRMAEYAGAAFRETGRATAQAGAVPSSPRRAGGLMPERHRYRAQARSAAIQRCASVESDAAQTSLNAEDG